MASFLFTVIFTLVVLLNNMLAAMPTSFRLERNFPVNKSVDLDQLKFRDSVRHSRLLPQNQSSVVDFHLQGNSDPNISGLYFTRVQLGSPPKEYHVQIDTGSDVLWISCDKCTGTPRYSGLQIPLHHYDPSSSSTASLISCSDRRCRLGTQSSDPGCSGPNNRCNYKFTYGDRSGTSGFYVSDLIHLDTILEDSTLSNASASILFGCSTTRTGDLAIPDEAVDGVFGFGPQGVSVIAQLSKQGVAPNVFSHCLVGSGVGGGILVLGQIIEPSMVFTPLITSQPYYNVNLLSISVNGQTLSINPSMFAKSGSQLGTIIDSGTTLVYLPEKAHASFVDAITRSVSQSVRFVKKNERQCYVATSRMHDMFPNVSLNFAGGASMILRPQDYLLPDYPEGGAVIWCMGFQARADGMTIIGDLVLKDRAVVYDLGGKRIGWANYDCTSSVNVSTTSTAGRSEHMICSSSSLILIVALGFLITSIS